MLLIKGEILENKDTNIVIETLKEEITATLFSNKLKEEDILNAADQLVNDFFNGSLKEELLPYINELEFQDDEVKEMIEQFHSISLQKRIDQELGSIKKNKKLRIAPKGVLLHIAAGNLDVLPAFSVLEGLLTRNINLLKLPSMDNGLSIFLLKKLIEYQPVLKEYIYVFDTPSSDLITIQKLMEFANAIVVWGSDEAISAIRKNAPINTEIIEWGHKLSFCYIADLTITDDVLIALAEHMLKTNQLLCNSVQGIYLDTIDEGEIITFGERFSKILNEVEKRYSLPTYLQGKVTIELLTKQLEAIESADKFYLNSRSSVTYKEDSILELSGLYGNIWIKSMKQTDVINNLFLNKSYLQTVAIYPTSQALIDLFSQVGCTSIRSIDQLSTALLQTHDGRFSLQQYIRIVELSIAE